MFIPCAQEIFYYHGSVRIASTNRMRAQDAGLVLVPGLEIAATSWKQTTPTLSNSRCGRGPLPLPPGTVPTLRGPVPTLRDQSLHFANRKAAKSLKTSRKKKINRYTLPRAEGAPSSSLTPHASPSPLAAVAANRYGPTSRNRRNSLQTKEKIFSTRYANAMSGFQDSYSPLT
jgi:hypothetical protein